MSVFDILRDFGLINSSSYIRKSYVKIVCPFHADRDPSLCVIVQSGYKARPEGFSKCFGCGKTLRNKVHLLQELLKLPRFKHKARQYRNLLKPVKEAEFEIYSPDGNLAYIQEIWFYPEKGKKEARYAYRKNGKLVYGIPAGQKKWPYGFHTVRKGQDLGFVLLESPQDAKSLEFVLKGQTVIATCGVTNWHSHWDKEVLEYLKSIGYSQVCIIPQADKQARAWAINMYEKCKAAGLKTYISFVCERENVKDLAELIESIDTDDLDLIQEIVDDRIKAYTETDIPILWRIAPEDLDCLKIKELPSGIVISCEDGQNRPTLVIDAQVKQSSREGVIANVSVESNIDYAGRMLSYKVNLSSPISFERFRKAFIQDLPNQKRILKVDIPELIRQEVLCFLKKEKYVNLSDVRIERPQWLFEPLIYKNAPTLIYAPKAAGKTTLSCLIGLLVQNGIPTGKKIEKGNVLYLDWENFESVIKAKIESLIDYYSSKLGISRWEYPFYLRCVYPLTVMESEIRKIVIKEDISLVIIDSLIPSLGGSSNDANVAGSYFSVIRELNYLGCSVLVLNHVSKAEMDSDDYTWLGSVMFGNLARIVWQINTQVLDDEMYLTLNCRYNNYGRLKNAFDVVFKFGESDIESISILDSTDNLHALPFPQRIVNCLKTGAKSFEEIGTQVCTSEDEFKRKRAYLSTALNRLQKKGIVCKLPDGRWGLKIRDGGMPD